MSIFVAFLEYVKKIVLNDNVLFDELESEIYDDEILETIKKLKRNEAHCEECLLNEFFIELKEYILPYLSDMFSRIFNSGHFPDDWSKAVIIPVFKKGIEVILVITEVLV